MKLREYQLRAIADLRAAYARGKRAPCLVLPTGAGKCVIAAEIIRSALTRGTRCLFLAHRTELISQAVDKLASAGVTDVRIIRAQRDAGNLASPITVASIQTLTRREQLPDAGLILIDEAHHTPAETWASLAGRYASARLLGMTATPARADGQPLGDIFDSIVVGATVAELVALGHLVPCKVWAPSEPLDTGELALPPLEAWQRYADNRPTIVFATTLEHAERTAQEFENANISADVIDGKMPHGVRASKLIDFSAGLTRVLVNVYCLTEGWDSPSAAVCMLLRRPLHAGTFLQMVGRVLRPSPGKDHALLLDLAGSVHLHGLPDAERTYSLDGHGITRSDRTPLRQCPECGFVTAGSPVTCPTCNAVWPTKMTPLPQSIGVGLGEVTRATPRPMRPRMLPSKYRGRCRTCPRPIAVGEMIAWIAGMRPEHKTCFEERLLQGVR